MDKERGRQGKSVSALIRISLSPCLAPGAESPQMMDEALRQRERELGAAFGWPEIEPSADFRDAFSGLRFICIAAQGVGELTD
jgi:hypothetical protein